MDRLGLTMECMNKYTYRKIIDTHQYRRNSKDILRDVQREQKPRYHDIETGGERQ